MRRRDAAAAAARGQVDATSKPQRVSKQNAAPQAALSIKASRAPDKAAQPSKNASPEESDGKTKHNTTRRRRRRRGYHAKVIHRIDVSLHSFMILLLFFFGFFFSLPYVQRGAGACISIAAVLRSHSPPCFRAQYDSSLSSFPSLSSPHLFFSAAPRWLACQSSRGSSSSA